MIANKIKRSFNRAANTYDEFSQVQKQAGIHLITQLKTIKSSFQTVIDLGCGTGYITAKLLDTIEYNEAHALDFSEKLIDIAKNYLAEEKINIRVQNFDDMQYINADLIFANMAIQWSQNVDQLLKKIANDMSHKGLLVFSIPIEGTLTEFNDESRNPYFTHKEIIQLLVSAGFEIRYTSTNTYIEKYNSLLSAIQAFKATGANCVVKRCRNRVLNRQQLMRHRESSLTYHIGFYIAEKRD